MQHFQYLNRVSRSQLRKASLVSAVLASFLLHACGGGGGTPLVPEAVVTSVANAQVMEGSAGNSFLEFAVQLDKPVERGLVVTYSTIAVDKPTGYAKGGAACTEGIDYISHSKSTVTIAPGSQTGKLAVLVCGDASFEPHELLTLTWSHEGAAGGSVTGTILNDDAGGLSGTGSTTLLTGLTAFGRDSNPLTNNAADGALGFSFDKSGSCVLDKVSGLTWQKGSFVSKPYADLAAYVAGVNDAKLCTFGDWRLPTANELMNLMDISQTTGKPSNADYLGVAADAMSGHFWSSELTATSSTANAWFVDTDSNGVITWEAQSDSKNVRLVRGGSATASVCNNNDGRLTDHKDGTVSDARTGLMWKTCPEGTSGGSCATGAHASFDKAADVVSRLVSANKAADQGYSDWRVPTRNELASLVNRACSRPSILSTVFPRNETGSYISANVGANAPADSVWAVDFFDGNVSISFWSTSTGPRSYYLRLVRAGQ